MNISVELKDIVDEMEVQVDESHTYLNKETGEIVFITSDELRAAEDEEDDDAPEWMQENRLLAIDILENFDKYVELPTKFDIHEYSIMEDFCYSVSDERTEASLLRVVRGRGAFRRFKDEILDLGIEDQWYAFRDDRFKKIAREWCRDNGIDFVE